MCSCDRAVEAILGQCGIVKGKISPCTGLTQPGFAPRSGYRGQSKVPKVLPLFEDKQRGSKSFTQSVSASQGSIGIQLLK